MLVMQQGWGDGSWDEVDDQTLGAMFGRHTPAVNPQMTKKCTCGHYEAGHDSVGCEICDPKATAKTPKKDFKCKEFTASTPTVSVMLYYCKDCSCANVLHKDMSKKCLSITDCKCDKYAPGGTGFSYRTCDHWRDAPLKVGNGVLLASAFSDHPNKEGWLTTDKPDLGIYLYDGWLKAIGGSASGVAPIYKAPYPYIYVPWPDMNAIPVSFMQKLVGRIAVYLDKGKQVEIACMGGHGRTGTLVAAVVGQVTGWEAEKSIKWVRKSHCDKALESASQIDSVYETLGEEKPKHAPAPTKNYATQWKSTTIMPPSTWKPEWGGDRCLCLHLRTSHWTIRLQEEHPTSPKVMLRKMEDATCFRCSCDGWDLGKLAGHF